MINHHEQIQHKFTPRDNQVIAINNTVEGLQKVGFHFLALDMSLGKTKVSLNSAEILHNYGLVKRILVIRPAGIKGTWVEEIEKHTFLPKPLLWESSKVKTKKFQYKLSSQFLQEISIVIMNLEAFQGKNKDLSAFLKAYGEEDSLIILDESSKIKNMSANRTSNLIDLTKHFKYKINLSGTMIEETPLDIFSQMEFLAPNFWYTDKKPKSAWYLFKNRYAIFKEIRIQEGRTIKTVVGTRRTEEIANKIAPYVTRQKCEDWLDLPEQIPMTYHVDMCREQQKAYDQFKEDLYLEYGEDEILTGQQATAVLLRLRQIAGGYFPVTGEPIGKVNALKFLLEDISGYSKKVIISASFVAEIQGIEKALIKEYGKDQVVTYYGGTKDKQESLRAFKNEARFMVLNPDSGAYGLNLQHCSLMYFYSRNFSYAKNVQLEKRIHRPGQKFNCIYKDIVAKGTVQDHKVMKAIRDKKQMVASFEDMAVNLTLKDLLN